MTSGHLPPHELYPSGRPGVETRYVELPNGIRLRVAQSGPADGPPVVLLHGWGASVFTWRFLLPELALAGYRGLAIDLRGHGLSAKPLGAGAYTRDALVSDVLAALDALSVEQAAVIGWSLGGAIALRLALDHANRVAALVLVNPIGVTPNRIVGPAARLSPGVLDVLAPYLLPRWIVGAVLRWASGDANFLSDRDVDEYWAPSRDSNYFRAMRALLCEFDWSPATEAELARLSVPTLAVVGGADRLVEGVGPVVSRLPRSHVVAFPGAGHMVHEERAEEVDRAIVDFLERQLKS